MAMPKPELALEKACRSQRSRGAGIGLKMKDESLEDHQERSSDTSLTEGNRAKGWGLHKPSMDSKLVR